VRSEDWIADLPRMLDRWGPGSSSATAEAGSGDAGSAGGESQAASSGSGSITVSDAFAAASEDLTAVYVTIDNAGDDDTLVGARSSAAGDITLMSGEDGSAMEDADSVDIPTGTTAFAAGAGHIMVELDDALEAGDTLPLDLEFAKAGTVTVDVEVLSWDQMVDRIEGAGGSGS
jgi:hypothetical protein